MVGSEHRRVVAVFDNNNNVAFVDPAADLGRESIRWRYLLYGDEYFGTLMRREEYYLKERQLRCRNDLNWIYINGRNCRTKDN